MVCGVLQEAAVMHAVGLQSALAIRRQRKRREEQKRAKERRYSLQSTDSGLTSPHGSHCSGLDRTGSRRSHVRKRGQETMLDTKVVTSLGMLHVGVVFIVLGLFLIGSGLLPDDVSSWSALASIGWWNELVCTGLFALALGIFLVLLNKYISKKEEEDLEKYVQGQLTRSRSGNRLERDVETGGMLTKHHRRERRAAKEDEERGLEDISSPGEEMSPKSPDNVQVAPTHHGFVNPVAVNGDATREHHLDQIMEEDYSNSDRGDEEARRMEFFNKDTFSGYSTNISTAHTTPSDTRELLSNGRHHQMIMSNI